MYQQWLAGFINGSSKPWPAYGSTFDFTSGKGSLLLTAVVTAGLMFIAATTP